MTNVKTNSIKAWLLAARPKTLTGAAIPVMLGCALAFIYGHFQLTPALLCFLFAFLMQIDANFINDLFDFLKGSDREDRLGPERACAQGWISPRAMRNGIIVTVLFACLIGSALLFLCRMGADHSRTSLRTLRFSSIPQALIHYPTTLGRCSGHRIFRIRPRGRNVLRAGADMDFGHNGSFSDLRTAD